jgi:hypothetical protein
VAFIDGTKINSLTDFKLSGWRKKTQNAVYFKESLGALMSDST